MRHTRVHDGVPLTARSVCLAPWAIALHIFATSNSFPSPPLRTTPPASHPQADMILMVGANPRWESPVFNARIRKTFVDGAQVGGGLAQHGGLGAGKGRWWTRSTLAS